MIVLIASLLVVSLAPVAEPPGPGWDFARTTSPTTIEELRALEARIQLTHAKVLPSVVGLIVGPGSGSGVIVREDGLVLTAAHVIGKPGASVRFVLPDGSRVRGRALGMDTKTDCGMARITDPPPKSATWPGAAEGKWPAVPLGQAANLKRGQWLIALGHAGGPKPDRPPPIRVGRLEALSRSDKTVRTTCAIAGGDAGGPVFDLAGHLVAVHSRIGLFLDYNLHVPVEESVADWDRLARGEMIGKTIRADLGLELAAREPVVTAVTAGGPAEKAGVRPGDVLTRFEGEVISTADEVKLLLHGKDPGQRAEVEVRRGSERIRLTITMGRMPAPTEKQTDK